MLAGGSTPVALYRLLAGLPPAAGLPWGELHLWLGDERWVTPDHHDSNWGMIRRELLAGGTRPVAAARPMGAGGLDRDGAARAYEATLRREAPLNPAGLPRLDLVLLGMGADGHTASLFPGAQALEERRRLVVATQRPDTGAWRLTVTLPLLVSAAEVWLLTRVADKEAALLAALSAGSELPAAKVTARCPRVTWWLDEPWCGRDGGATPEAR